MHLRLSDLREAQATGEAWVLVTIVETRGSTPREVGASMLVFAQHTHGTIGGGELEFQATATARELLREGENTIEIEVANVLQNRIETQGNDARASGLLGPVLLQAEHRIVLSPPSR